MPLPTVQIDLETPIHPTESVDKVKRAILNLFPDAEFANVDAGVLRATSMSLDKLKERLAAQAIRDASRKVLMNGVRPGHLLFMLSKQAAFVSRVSFSEDGPLGDIVVIVRTEQPGLLVDDLTDKKDDGRPAGRPPRPRPENDEYLGHLED